MVKGYLNITDSFIIASLTAAKRFPHLRNGKFEIIWLSGIKYAGDKVWISKIKNERGRIGTKLRINIRLFLASLIFKFMSTLSRISIG